MCGWLFDWFVMYVVGRLGGWTVEWNFDSIPVARSFCFWHPIKRLLGYCPDFGIMMRNRVFQRKPPLGYTTREFISSQQLSKSLFEK